MDVGNEELGLGGWLLPAALASAFDRSSAKNWGSKQIGKILNWEIFKEGQNV
jgi:hypothetical protein